MKMLPLDTDKLILFTNDSGVNQAKFSNESRESRSFYLVYDCASSEASDKIDLQQSFDTFIGFHSVDNQIYFFFKQVVSSLPMNDKIIVNEGINMYSFDIGSNHLTFLKTISIGRSVRPLNNIMLTPDKKYFVFVYRSNYLEVLDSSEFIKGTFTATVIPNYDNFLVQNCIFEEPYDKYILMCFMLQDDTVEKLNPINSLIISFNLFPETQDPKPFDYFKEFYPLKINQQIGLQEIEMLLIVNPSSVKSSEQYLILRIGTSIYDIFNLDKRVLMIKNDMVKSKLNFSACSPYARVPNSLEIIPKYNIKTMILFFSIGFGAIMLILFLCHFKFIKDSILNKYKKFKIDEMNTILDVADEEKEEDEGEGLKEPEKASSMEEIQ
jgi:hypothetical protein